MVAFMKANPYFILTIALVVTFFTVGIAGAETLVESPVATQQAPQSLTGITWYLVALNEGDGSLSIKPGTMITAFFDTQGEVSGLAGCNQYIAYYEATTAGLQMGPPATTKMTCSEPAGVMTQETVYLSTLQGAASYSLSGNTLTINDSGGNALLTYSTVPPAITQEEQNEIIDLTSRIFADTDQTWTIIFEDHLARTYSPPNLVVFEDNVSTGCGQVTTDIGPLYCSQNQTVYIDLNFLNEMEQLLDPADSAYAYVISHEVGHHVQNLLGTLQYVNQQQSLISEAEADALSEAVELQADCYAAVWAYQAQFGDLVLERGDLEEALNTASFIGYDRNETQPMGYVVPDTFTHGTSAQRVDAFRKGMDAGLLSDCNCEELPEVDVTGNGPIVRSPHANFTANQTSGNSPLSVQFSDKSTGTPPFTYYWNFGDGSAIATTANPVHTFVTNANTTFVVNLTVSNSAGSSSKSISIPVTVPQTPIQDSPFVLATVSNSIVAKGDDMYIRGVAEGDPSQGVVIWIIGNISNSSFIGYSIEYVNNDGTFEYEIDGGMTSGMTSGQYFVVVQHPMNNDVFDVYPMAADGYAFRYVVGPYPTANSVLFTLEGPGSLPGSDAVNALTAALDNSMVDDNYTKLQFMIEVPEINIHQIPEVMLGDQFEIEGTTNLAVDDELLVEVYSSSFGPTEVPQTGIFNASGTVNVVRGNDGFNTWSFPVDTTTFKADEYIVNVSAIGLQSANPVTAITLFNVVQFVPTTEPTTTPIPSVYDADAAVQYAKIWGGVNRNPEYHDYTYEGGDCANFVSQCLIAGGLTLDTYIDKNGSIIGCDNLNAWLKSKGYYSEEILKSQNPSEPTWFSPGDIAIYGNASDKYQHAIIAVGYDTDNFVLYNGHTEDMIQKRITYMYGNRAWDRCTFYRLNSSSVVPDSPKLVTDEISQIGTTFAILKGHIENPIPGQSYEVCFRYEGGSVPKTKVGYTTVSTGNPNYEYNLTGLESGTAYYYRAVHADSQGTGETEKHPIDADNVRTFSTEDDTQIIPSDNEALEAFLDNISQLVENNPAYFNDEWGISKDQYKIVLATLAYAEGGKFGYSAHSSTVRETGPDCYQHINVTDFYFSRGIGPFQIDLLKETWSTIEKLNSTETTKITLEEHKKLLGNNVNDINDIRTLASVTWMAYGDETYWAGQWQSLTGTNWYTVKGSNKANSLPFTWENFKTKYKENKNSHWYPYADVIKPIGQKYWIIDNKDDIKLDSGKSVIIDKPLDTYHIKAKGDGIEWDYYYCIDEVNGTEIWAYYNPNDNQHHLKSIFWREYISGAYPENIIKNPGVIQKAGKTLNHIVISDKTTSTNVDVALIIDSSGSMTSNDPKNLRKSAAHLFIDLVDDEDKITIVDFDESVTLRQSLIIVAGNREKLKNAVNRVDSIGGTNIGGGLLTGYNQLSGDAADPIHEKAAIILTDGQHNTGTTPSSIIPKYQEKGWPIYSIALSDDADKQLLNQMSSMTGGQYYPSPSPESLLDIYNKISLSIKGSSQLDTRTDHIALGETKSGSLPIDASVTAFNVVLTWPGSDLDLVLYYPGGNQIPLNQTSPNGTDDPTISYIAQKTYEVYKVRNVTPGTWRYDILGIDVQNEEDFTLTLSGITPIRLNASISKQNYEKGESVQINAVLLDGNQGITGAQVIGTVTLPDFSKDVIELSDEGNGYYGTIFSNTTQKGLYTLFIEAEKEEIIRQKQINFEVSEEDSGTINANFIAENTSGTAPLIVQFTDTSTNDPTSWAWDFGDGANSTEQNPVHTYTNYGTYNVSLAVTNAAGEDTIIKNDFIQVIPMVGGDTGYYLIHCNVEGAEVYFDQDSKGVITDGTLLVKIYLTATPYHRYSVSKAGYVTVNEALPSYPAKDQTKDIFVTLVKVTDHSWTRPPYPEVTRIQPGYPDTNWTRPPYPEVTKIQPGYPDTNWTRPPYPEVTKIQPGYLDVNWTRPSYLDWLWNRPSIKDFLKEMFDLR